MKMIILISAYFIDTKTEPSVGKPLFNSLCILFIIYKNPEWLRLLLIITKSCPLLLKSLYRLRSIQLH